MTPTRLQRRVASLAPLFPLAFVAFGLALYAVTTPHLSPFAPPQAPERVYVVDRIEGQWAVMIDDATAQAVDVLADRFPFPVAEGDAVVVPIGPQWTLARRVTQ